MSLLAALALVVAIGVANGNMHHAHPASGTCLCVHGSGVNARDNPGTHGTTPVASLNTGDCFTFHGGILTKDGYTWYQLQHVNGHLAWVAGAYLSQSTSSHCSGGSSGGSSGSTSCSDSVAKDYACKILDLQNQKKIVLWAQHPSGHPDNAYALNNIQDACHGKAVSRSHYTCTECPSPGAPGGHVCLSRTLLHYLYTLAHGGYIHVNEIAGACHGCNSRHYKGMAVDLHNDGRSSTYMKTCTDMGGYALDEGNHIHCQFYH